jgi:hypothetical protein
LGRIINERIYAVELSEDNEPILCESSIIGDFSPGDTPSQLPNVAFLPEANEFMQSSAYQPFLDEVKKERISEVARIDTHVELSMNEIIKKADEDIGKIALEIDNKTPGAEGRMAMAEKRHDELRNRREKRRQDLERERSLSLQGIERITSVLVLPHPDREDSEIKHLRQNLETEAIAMKVAIEYEQSQGRHVNDVHKKNLGYDITSLDTNTSELRLIEIKGIGASTGTVLLTPNERNVAEDRRDCYWLYVVYSCDTNPTLMEPIKDPIKFEWREVKKVDHYQLSINTLKNPIEVYEKPPSYGDVK